MSGVSVIEFGISWCGHCLRAQPSIKLRLLAVEGFADPSGSTALNKRLGQSRADVVRDYLITAGLPAQRVRALSYGEEKNRQVRPGATGTQGRATAVWRW